MNVLIYGFTGSILGGIELFVLNMNEHMSRDCVFDYIIEGDIDCAFDDRIHKRGGEIFFVPWLRNHPIGFIRSIWSLLGERKRQGTNIFYYQLFSMTKLLPAILAKMRGYNVILHAHNNGLQKSSRVYILTHKVGKALARCFNFIHFTNSQLSSDFMFGSGVKSELIYNAIDITRFSFSEKKRESVREEFACGEKTIVGFVGRLVRQKNPIFMIRVFAELVKICPNSELWVVGDGELQNIMELEIKDKGIDAKVKWLGRRDDVNMLMQGMDLLLQPSLFEGLGIVLIEAQTMGLAVISSEKVIPQEAVVSETIRLLPLSETPCYWAERCLALLETLKVCDRKVINISDHFDISFEARRLEKLLRSYN